jgi:AraC family transcriptional regulator
MMSTDEYGSSVTSSCPDGGSRSSRDRHARPDYDARLLLYTSTVLAWDVQCQGVCRGKTDEEHAPGTRFVFPHRGVYIHSVGSKDHVADTNQMVVINADEPYQASHPVAGGDATLTLALDPATLLEVMPPKYRSLRERPALNRSSLRVDARTQILAAQLRQRLLRRPIDRLKPEILALQLIRHALGNGDAYVPERNIRRRPEKIADQVKLLLASDPWRRWTLAAIAAEVNVTPVYVTDAFRRAEGIPLYRYHLRLRLASALTVLPDCGDLSLLALDLGFHSHSHFSAAFKKTFGQTPTQFKKSVTGDSDLPDGEQDGAADLLDSAEVYLSRTVCNGCDGRRDPQEGLSTVVA